MITVINWRLSKTLKPDDLGLNIRNLSLHTRPLQMAELVEKPKEIIVVDKRIHRMLDVGNILIKAICFDGPNLVVFTLAKVFQQSRMLSMVLKNPTQVVASDTKSSVH
jgi:hypothetical protein